MEKQEVRQQIGGRLREARQAAKLSQEDVASTLQVSRQAVSQWEGGVTMPDSKKWYRIGLLYGTSLDYLVYGIRTKPVTDNAILNKIFAPVEPSAGATALETVGRQ